MATSAEADYAALAGEVAATLNAIVFTKDPKARLDMAIDARRRLASWPREHYGYRADDVREMLGLLDEAISGLRAAAGETSFRARPGCDRGAAGDRRERRAVAASADRGRSDRASDRGGEGHRHGRRSRVDASRRRRRARRSSKRAAPDVGDADRANGRFTTIKEEAQRRTSSMRR